MTSSATDAVSPAPDPWDEPHNPVTCGDPSCAQVEPGSEWLGQFMAVAPSGRVSFHHGDDLHERVHRGHREEFAKLTVAYAADPTGFVTCYRWLQLHPVFWRYRVPNRLRQQTLAGASSTEVDALVAQVETLEQLDDTHGLAEMWMSVTEATEPDFLGGPGARFLFEHGPHMFASETRDDSAAHVVGLGGHSTHDIELDVWAASYEDGIVKLAARVFEVYGTDRSRVHAVAATTDEGAASATPSDPGEGRTGG